MNGLEPLETTIERATEAMPLVQNNKSCCDDKTKAAYDSCHTSAKEKYWIFIKWHFGDYHPNEPNLCLWQEDDAALLLVQIFPDERLLFKRKIY